jgi:hypothetical protein
MRKWVLAVALKASFTKGLAKLFGCPVLGLLSG